MKGFEAKEVQTEQNSIFVRVGGSGPTILLLHGFPQTHLMWRNVAPILSREFTVVCADLRGYGRSGCPPSTVDHSPYSKRAMAQEMVLVMEQLGFSTDRKLLFARAAVLDAARVKTDTKGQPSRGRPSFI
jgi:haloacetate dehalogenase